MKKIFKTIFLLVAAFFAFVVILHLVGFTNMAIDFIQKNAEA